MVDVDVDVETIILTLTLFASSHPTSHINSNTKTKNRTMEKNEQHGPCKLTGKKVFGSNHFKDLTHEEFKAKYLTGYAGPKTDEMDNHKRRQLRTSNEFRALMEKKEHAHPNRATPTDVLSSNGLHDPSILSDRISRHESVHERYLKHVEKTPKLSKTYYNREDKAQEKACKCGSKNYNNNNSNSNSNSNSYYNKYNDYNNYYYSSNNYGSRRLSGIFKRHSGMFGKTYYNKSEKQKICGSSYGKTYYNKNSSNNNKVDCSKYKLEADFDYDEVSNERTSSNNCGWYDMSCWMRKIFNPLFSGHTRESMYNNYNYPSCELFVYGIHIFFNFFHSRMSSFPSTNILLCFAFSSVKSY